MMLRQTAFPPQPICGLIEPGLKSFGHDIFIALTLLAGTLASTARPVPGQWPPVQMKRPVDTNLPPLHTVTEIPGPDTPKIHFYDKLNPVWWVENANEPVPPAWYLPDDKHRALKWHFRNPFHNFDFYVIGVADREFTRSGHYPEKNSDPHGGWDFEMERRRIALLPYVSCERSWMTFYFGWRESGAFGLELRFHHQKPSSPTTKNGNSNGSGLQSGTSEKPELR